MKLQLAWSVPVVATVSLVTGVLAGCSGSDSGNAQSSSSGSASSSTTTSTPAVDTTAETEKAAADYKAYSIAQAGQLVTAVKTLTDAVRANDLVAAQAAYAPSRMPWERIEPIAELISDVDGKVDSRVDDFSGVDDPAFTGWHRLEYLLFEKNTTEGGAPFADKLDADIAGLVQELPNVDVKPINVSNGAAELIEEVSQGKITGEEERYSKTDLWDFDANLQGSRDAIGTLNAALVKADPALLGKIEAGLNGLFDTMRPLRRGDGWVLYCTANDPYPSARCPEVTVTPEVVDNLKSQLAGLSENLSQVSGVLGLA